MTTYRDFLELTSEAAFTAAGESVYAAVDKRSPGEVSKGLDAALALARAVHSLSIDTTTAPSVTWSSSNLVIAGASLILRFTYRDPETGTAVSRSISLAAGTYGFSTNTILLIQLPFSGNLSLTSASAELKYFSSDAAVTTFLNSDRTSNGALSMQRYVQIARKEGGAIDILGKIRVPDGRTLAGLVTDSAYALDTVFDDLIKTVNQDRTLLLEGDETFTYTVPSSTNVTLNKTSSGALRLHIADRVLADVDVSSVTLTDANPWLVVTLTRDEAAAATPTLSAAADSGTYAPEADGDEMYFLARKTTGGTTVTWLNGTVWEADSGTRTAGIFPGTVQDTLSTQVLKSRLLWMDASAAHPDDPSPALPTDVEDFMALTGPSGWKATGLGFAAWRMAMATIYALDSTTVYGLDVSRVTILPTADDGMFTVDYVDATTDVYLGGVSLDTRIGAAETAITTLDTDKADSTDVDAADAVLQGNIDDVAADLSTLEGNVAVEVAGSTALDDLTSNHPYFLHPWPGFLIPGYGVDGLAVTGGISAIACDGEYVWYARETTPFTIFRCTAREMTLDGTWSLDVAPTGKVTQMECVGGSLYYALGVNLYRISRSDGTVLATLTMAGAIEAFAVTNSQVFVCVAQVITSYNAALVASGDTEDLGALNMASVSDIAVAQSSLLVAGTPDSAAGGAVCLDLSLTALGASTEGTYTKVCSDGETFYTINTDDTIQAWPGYPKHVGSEVLNPVWESDLQDVVGTGRVDIACDGREVIVLRASDVLVSLSAAHGGVVWTALAGLGASVHGSTAVTRIGADAYGLVTSITATGTLTLVRRADGRGPKLVTRVAAGAAWRPFRQLVIPHW